MALPIQALPTVGQPASTEDPKTRAALLEIQTILGALDRTNFAAGAAGQVLNARGTTVDPGYVGGAVGSFPGAVLDEMTLTATFSGRPVMVSGRARLRQANSSGPFGVFLVIAYDGGLPPSCTQDNVRLDLGSVAFGAEVNGQIMVGFTPSAGSHTITLRAYSPVGGNLVAVGTQRALSVVEA